MFWSQEDEDSINDLFIKENLTLEEVLDHESILQECKIQNEKLIKFFCLRRNFLNLLNYVLVTPTEDIEENVRFKYPSLICEVLTSDIHDINEQLVNGIRLDNCSDSNNSYSEISFVYRLFNKFDNEMSINPLTLSFLIKILLNILKHNNEAVMSDIMRRENSVDLFLKHVDNNAIIVFFSEFLMCDDENSATRIQWLKRDDFVCKCAQLFTVDENRNNSVQSMLCEVIGSSGRFFSNKEMREEIRSQCYGQTFLDLIFGHLTNPRSDSTLITGCLKVIRAIVDFEIESEGQKMNSVKEMILKHFYSLILLLSSPPKQIYDPMPTTIGRITPFGPTRMEIVNLLESLLKLTDPDIIKGISETNVFMVLMAFISQYKWNTIFQLGMLRIFDILFGDLSENCQYKCLLEHLVIDYDIYHWFMEIIKETAKVQNPRPGTMGLLWKIGNHLDGLWHSKLSKELICKELDENGVWTEVVNAYLIPRNIENVITPPKIDSSFRDLESKMVDIDEDDAVAFTHPDTISALFLHKSPMLDEIFGTSTGVDLRDDWNSNDFKLDHFRPFILSNDVTGDDDDSSSDDEESPAVIRQQSEGTASKYLLSDLSDNNDLDLFDVPECTPDLAIPSINFEDLWKTSSPPKSQVHDNS